MKAFNQMLNFSRQPWFRLGLFAWLCVPLAGNSAATDGPKLAIYPPGQAQPEAANVQSVVAWGHSGFGRTAVPTGLTDVTAIATGDLHTVALKQDGSVVAWGYNQHGQTTVPAGLTGVTAIAAGDYHSVALKQDGSVVAWGDNGSGQATIPAGLTGVTTIAAGWGHTVALKQDGSVVAWGDNGAGQATIPAGLTGVTTIAAGDYHTVALKQDGSVVAWGYNYYGQTTVPAGLTGVIAIAAGDYHTVALKQDGSVVAWGDNRYGQTTIPAGLRSVTAIAAGAGYSVAAGMGISTTTADFGTNNRGQTTERTIRLSSVGNSGIQGLAASIYGTNADQFTLLGSNLPNALASGDSAELNIRFTPSGTGNRSAWLRIDSNDPDFSPYLLRLEGVAAQPEISVESPASIVSGSTIVMGSTIIADPVLTRTFTLRNTGSGSLDGLVITRDGANPDDFAVSPLAGTTLAPGSSQTFTVILAPSAPGTRTAALHIASNDADENPFDILLTGQASALDIAFAGDGGARLTRPSQDVDLGTIDTGTNAERSFTIRNTSSAPVTGLRLMVEGADAAAFSLVPALPASLAPGEAITFTVLFTASERDARSATLRFISSQGTDATVNFSAVVRAARMEVKTVQGIRLSHLPQVVAWGSNFDGQTTVPAGLTGVTAIAAGQSHTVTLKQDGSIVAWGNAYYGQSGVPAGLTGVIAIAAGVNHTVALKRDGNVVAWGDVYYGQCAVPAGLTSVTAIAAGGFHTVALKRDGNIVAWGENRYGQATVPAGLMGVTAIAAGWAHTVALKQDGSVVAWGYNHYGQTTVPAGLTGVTAIAAGAEHTVALKRDGSVVAWGWKDLGQTSVPTVLTGVTAIAAGWAHTVALKHDGSVVAWGDNFFGQSTVPTGLTGVTAIAAGGSDTVAIGKVGIVYSPTPLGIGSTDTATLSNSGTLPLAISRSEFVGPDADQFSFTSVLPTSLAIGTSNPITIRCTPSRAGPLHAQLKIYSNDPDSPYLLDLNGAGLYDVTATKAGVAGSALTYGPLTVDAQTGLVLQKMTFTNLTTGTMCGLRLILSKVAAGVTLYSSSVGDAPGTVEVIYSKPIAAHETVQFVLSYFDPKRRVSSAVQPIIRAEALQQSEPRSEPVVGTVTPVLSVRDTVNGPLVEWNSKSGAVYVVEYSEDAGKTWFSAVHRLSKSGTRMVWVDRGQPETFAKPVNKAARSYRVKRL